MSIFGDYKSYKNFEPAYDKWKIERNILDAKRMEYIKQNPQAINNIDIQRGKTLIRAIDIMDEYSQKRAEDMEVATESTIGSGLELAMLAGAGLGYFAGGLKPFQKLFTKFAKNGRKLETITKVFSVTTGALIGTAAAFPLYAWGARAEVAASRRGRFEAMRKELDNPKGFAVLSENQIREAEKRAETIVIEEDKKKKFGSGFFKGLSGLKEMAIDSKEYKKQRKEFKLSLLEDEKHINEKLTPEEILDAKRDQQLLTKLVEKIDIASQDYAENAELASGTLLACVLGFGTLGDFILQKILGACKVKSAPKISVITKGAALIATFAAAIISAQISKQASRVGRFKVKQELLKNPEQLVYVSDEKTGDIKDIQIPQDNKGSMLEFLKHALKNNKEYNNYKKTGAKAEKKFYKAVEELDLTPEQIKDAKRLQKNTFKTFNKVDENSQKYSESVEALGQAVYYPLGIIFTLAGVAIGFPYLMKFAKSKNNMEQFENLTKYVGAILLSSLPGVLVNAIITKEQKKASRVANMLAINEMSDYRHFRG